MTTGRDHYLRWTPYLLHMSEEDRAHRMLASAQAKKSPDLWQRSVEERLAELEERVGLLGLRSPKDARAER